MTTRPDEVDPAYAEMLQALSDCEVRKAFEEASERLDEDEMAACLEEMKRRYLDF